MTTKKRKVRKKRSPLVKLICLGFLCLSAYLLFQSGKEILTTIQLQKELTEVQAQLDQVTAENEYLNSEKTKLQDPDYVENYARGKYMLSKDGEQIFHLPEDSTK